MITVINTGGTFNKIYDPIKGELIVAKNSIAIEKIVKSFYENIDFEIRGIIFKDSLEFGDEDRATLLNEIKSIDNDKIIVVHGTDTMDKSAQFIAKHIDDKCIVFTGSMKPFSIDPVEATANFTLAYSKISLDFEYGIFIAMHSFVLPYDKIVKNKNLGKFVRDPNSNKF